MVVWHRVRVPLRPDEVAEAAEQCTRSRQGLLVLGAPGVGASQFASDVATRLRRGGLAVVRWEDLDRRAGAPQSRHPGGDALVIATARVGAPLPAPLHAELRRRTTTWRLRNLTRTELESVLTRSLRMPVSGRLVEALWGASHGNLTAARAAYEAFDQLNLIIELHGRVHLALHPRAALARTEVTPEAWIAPSDEPALTSVALEPRLRREDVTVLHPKREVNELLERGLLVVRTDHVAQTLAVEPPLLASALRRRASAEDQERVYLAALDHARSDEPLPSSTHWALTHGRPVSVQSALAAARLAFAEHAYTLALHICEAAVAAQETPDWLTLTELLLVEAASLRMLDRFAEAAAKLEQAAALVRPRLVSGGIGAAEHSALFLETVTAHADLAHAQTRDPRGALDLIASAREVPGTEGLAAAFSALEVMHLAYSGRLSEAASVFTDLDGALPPPLAQRIEALHALALDARGEADEALVVLRRLGRRASSMPHADWASEEYLAAYLAVVLHTEGPAALQRDTTPFVAADRDGFVRVDYAMRRLADAEIASIAGDFVSAERAAADAVTAIELDGPEDYLPRAWSLHASAAAAVGDVATARAQLDRLRSRTRYESSLVGPDILAAEAATLSCLGEHASAHAIVLRLVERGLHGAAARAGVMGLLHGDRAICSALATLELSGAVPRIIHSLAVNVSRRGGARELLQLSREAGGRGEYVLAYAAARHASLATSPDSMLHAEAERAQFSAAGHLRGLGLDPAPRNGAGSAPLTRREAQIAALMSEGLANLEIAEALHLSKRTVEGHINRIYRKTGAVRPARTG